MKALLKILFLIFFALSLVYGCSDDSSDQEHSLDFYDSVELSDIEEPSDFNDVPEEVQSGPICNDSCRWANNTICDDGGPGSTSDICKLGSDCSDCGPRSLNNSEVDYCNDNCTYAHNGICEDGGGGASSNLCPLGSDCSDCIDRTPSTPDPDTGRTLEEVCQRWNAEYPYFSHEYWIPDQDAETCSPGQIHPDAYDDALRRLNLYRWLLQLEPVVKAPQYDVQTQAAATIMDANEMLSHTPDATWACYTEEGAEGASHSNIALGYRRPAETVDGYIGDEGVPSLGHRRWCFYPPLHGVSFGHHDKGGAMWVFDWDDQIEAPDFVAYPAPGPFPLQALLGTWSFSADVDFSDVKVDIVKEDGSDFPVNVEVLEEGAGLNTVAIFPQEDVSDRMVLNVEVSADGHQWHYRIQFVDCSWF